MLEIAQVSIKLFMRLITFLLLHVSRFSFTFTSTTSIKSIYIGRHTHRLATIRTEPFFFRHGASSNIFGHSADFPAPSPYWEPLDCLYLLAVFVATRTLWGECYLGASTGA